MEDIATLHWYSLSDTIRKLLLKPEAANISIDIFRCIACPLGVLGVVVITLKMILNVSILISNPPHCHS
jgi:hypothetical protein